MKTAKNRELSSMVQKLHHPLIIIAILVVALFYAIFMHTSGLGILAITLAIVILFISYDDEYGIKEFFKSLFTGKQI